MFDTAIATTTSAISTGLTTNLPLVLSIFGGLVVLGIVVHYVRKWIGRK